MWEACVQVMLKPGVLDPQGETVGKALRTLGYDEVQTVRVGKVLKIKVEGADQAAVAARVEEMCRRLLANPVIEQYSFQLVKESEG
ncbi:MAG TPA: phosphoribosylformylglycinamidine synthase subunit PurS [Firmicutes bacterium]|jgi:phosphoribosylformylglycinamidine synthase PurS subunit|nr:phosphoribosylformylglycinamidine synthase subunit PurS [Bacillota bacterium]